MDLFLNLLFCCISHIVFLCQYDAVSVTTKDSIHLNQMQYEGLVKILITNQLSKMFMKQLGTFGYKAGIRYQGITVHFA
jgi:hypothetical protein